jgi:hypothetical protein
MTVKELVKKLLDADNLDAKIRVYIYGADDTTLKIYPDIGDVDFLSKDTVDLEIRIGVEV